MSQQEVYNFLKRNNGFFGAKQILQYSDITISLTSLTKNLNRLHKGGFIKRKEVRRGWYVYGFNGGGKKTIQAMESLE